MDSDKITHVLHIASGDLWAGAEVQLFTLAKALHKNLSIRISVILMNHGRLEQQLQNTGIKVIVLDESKLNGLHLLYQLMRTVRTLKPNVIHTHRIKENIFGSIAALLSGNIPTLQTAHGASEHLPSWRHLSKRLPILVDWFCGRFLQHKIIAVSEDLASKLQNSYPKKKINVIENGIDLKAMLDCTTKIHPASKANVFKIGIAGRLVPVKRVDIFIETAHHFIQHHPETKIEFYIYGDGPLNGELKQLSQQLKIQGAVFFEGHCNNILEKLQEIDILLITSDHEGLPMILLEAMALGTPVVAHNVGGIPHLLDYGTCGVLVNEHDPSAFSQEIHQLINNQQKISEITQNATHRIEKQYSAEKNSQSYIAQYTSLLGKS